MPRRTLRRGLLMAAVALPLAAAPAGAQDVPVSRGGGQSGSVVSRVTGEEVRFIREPAFRPLSLGQDLLAGDLVRTGPQGALGILFVDRTVLRLHPGSELLVREVRPDQAELTLNAGTLWARAPRGEASVVVTTPTVAAAIRGTDWALTVEGDGSTRLTVHDGAVELTNEQGSLLTRAGESALARPGQAPVLIGVANRRERPQMLYTVSTGEAADLLTGIAEDLAGDRPENPGALALYRQGLAASARGDHAAAAQALTRAAPELGPDRAASARWLAAWARMSAGEAFRAPSATTADADAVGAALSAAVAGDLDRAQTALASVSAPSARAASVQLALLRDDGPRARAELRRLQAAAPGSVAALEAEAAVALDLDGDARTAIAALRRAVQLAPDSATTWNNLGLAEDAADHAIEAEAAFRRAMALEPAGETAAGNLAILLLDQERVAEARALAESLLARNPQSWLGLRALGRVQLQENRPEATETLLRALAAQPAASETSLALAIAAHQTGDAVRAAQELDAAARLDPNDATVALVRSIIALDAGDAPAAITAARRAAALMRAQTGGTRNVAADRDAGSPLANAWNAIGLEGWGRYAADRSFDPLSASSLFGEAFVDGISIGRGGPAVEGPGTAAVQGLMLDPLAASSRLRETDLLRRPFLDIGVGADVRAGDTSDRLLRLQIQGLARVPQPLAFALTIADTQTPVAAGRPRDSARDYALLVGAQPGPRLNAFALLGRNSSDVRRSQDLGLGLVNRDDVATDADSAAIGGAYLLGERAVLTFFASRAVRSSDSASRRFAATTSLFQIDIAATERTRTDFLALGYRGEDESGFWTAGVETTLTRSDIRGATVVTDLLAGTSVTTPALTSDRRQATRVHLDRRQIIGERLQLQGLVTLDRQSGRGLRTGGRAGLAWTPAEGHWLRAAVLSDAAPDASSFAPASVLGLLPVSLPHDGSGRLRGVLLRYDGELGDNVLLSLEHQRLDARGLSFPTDDPLNDLAVARSRLDATSLRLDWWPGGAVGVFGSVTHAKSTMRDGPFAGSPLPETPEWTASVGLGWLTTQQFSGAIVGTWTSERFSGAATPLPPVFTVDAGLSWQPLKRRASLRLDVVDLLDRRVAQPWGAPATGREVRLSGEFRF